MILRKKKKANISRPMSVLIESRLSLTEEAEGSEHLEITGSLPPPSSSSKERTHSPPPTGKRETRLLFPVLFTSQCSSDRSRQQTFFFLLHCLTFSVMC
ncbi:hypothetical protein CEXT_805121 [Caerostris extrusa]|uniref:Uncharacterized protein n=1 Tax=Caerostris extrusa TaxID=172846 RepID=A0AAV4PEZ7_CAEEX|nr:hypothetical protein CEXT_805121 [Caerostris extrusa]